MKKYLFICLIFITYLLYLSNFGAIGAVMDTRLIVVILSLITLLPLIIYVCNVKKRYLYVLLLFALFITFLSVKEYFLTYSENEIVFQNDGYDFYGTLYSPKSSNSNCFVVFLHGSGSEARKEYAFHARQLARNRITSFAYDKRGSGRSGGDTYDVGYNGYAKDAIAAITKIKTQNKFDKVGLFAVSEGEWVSLIVDSLIPIDFIVMISASGASPLPQTQREMTYRLERKGFDRNDMKEANNLYHEILTFNNDSLSRKEIQEKINQSKDKPWFESGEEFPEELFYYPWWEKVMNFKPDPYLEKTTTDILVLAGKDNESYPPDETANNFKQYKNVETIVFEKGDHYLLDWKFGQGVPPPFFVTGYLETYSKWILQQCNKNSAEIIEK